MYYKSGTNNQLSLDFLEFSCTNYHVETNLEATIEFNNNIVSLNSHRNKLDSLEVVIFLINANNTARIIVDKLLYNTCLHSISHLYKYNNAFLRNRISIFITLNII